ncbi:AzlD domain-containing protein [Parasporobacterium paucivorans]|uniref:Branched-chain amino acid transport protein n=1 Tax=Parasporobacterium paucivorans DSM 15970 TaxID=1122934 RepID=A0A1M6FP72_9FIRM|nr:AzlD domain-containing protein [Parasporobacterium paucivorans]SHI99465.1 Branched-chain amino acid transport protein [Parasporobacterium paucivorans DSM 15970]
MTKPIIAIFLMAAVTYLPRVLPIAILKKNISSRYIRSFLHFMPYAVLASLTFPDIFYSTTQTASAMFGTLAALTLAYFNKSLVVVALGAILAVFLFESIHLL